MQKTVGVSPKLIVAGLAAVATYLVTQTVLELPPWAVLLCQVVVILAGVYAAPPGQVQTLDPSAETRDLHENPDLGV
jgi:hypothetical protein